MNIKKPNRKKHGYSQHLNAPPETVFPLLCPVLEAEWVPDWVPKVVISLSGVCEQDCIFITPPEMPSEPENSIWIVTKYDPGNRVLEMYKVTPEHSVSKLEITLAGESDNSTIAHISYEITTLGPAGNKLMEEFTEEWYEGFMVEWEKQMNYYLETGNKIA
ncbi:MAG: hypothetical protein ABFR19_04180 [Pseudomonadota bacterium]